MSYSDFLQGKLRTMLPSGLSAVDGLAGPMFPHQVALTTWSLKRGRAAIFADTGLGKTRMELAWADAVHRHTGRQVVILTPLAVAAQMLREAHAMSLQACVVRESEDQTAPICICNYERLHKLDIDRYAGVVLDESSIIKHHTAKTLALLIETFGPTPYKLCATATPAPNDWTELGNHAEFLGIRSRSEMLAEYFCHDGGETQVWRLKGHARSAFWRWVSSWGAMVQSPADLGFDASAYELPPLIVKEHRVEVQAQAAAGSLFALEASTLSERREAKRGSLQARVDACAALVNADPQSWVVWCELNDESAALAAAIPGAVEIRGSQDADDKESRIAAFSEGRARVIVSKASITGWGLNWQHCRRMAFVGATDSWEGYYQAIRRCWRFGQTQPVHVHIFSGVLEESILRNLQRKEADAKALGLELARETHDAVMAEVIGQQTRETNTYHAAKRISPPSWLKSEAA